MLSSCIFSSSYIHFSNPLSLNAYTPSSASLTTSISNLQISRSKCSYSFNMSYSSFSSNELMTRMDKKRGNFNKKLFSSDAIIELLF